MVTNRLPFYLRRGIPTRYLGKTLTSYPGASTIPRSFEGNFVLVAQGKGEGAKLLSGIGPLVDTPVTCDEILFLTVGPPNFFTAGDGLVVVPISYSGADPTSDIYQIFLPSTASKIPIVSAVLTGVDAVDLTLNVAESLLGGGYTLKVSRSNAPTICFAIKQNAIDIEAAMLCTLTLTDLSGDGVFPNPPIVPGAAGKMVSVVGTGFLDGPISVALLNALPPFNTIFPTLVTIVDGMNMDIDFDTTLNTGFYEVVVTRTDLLGCSASIGTIAVISF